MHYGFLKTFFKFQLANYAFPGFQNSIDATAGDINKNRNLGLRPYVDYVQHFLGIEIKNWEDLKTAGLMTDEVSLFIFVFFSRSLLLN